MNAITEFNFDGSNVRTVAQGGEHLFIAKDICDILGMKNSRQALTHLDEDEKGVILNDTLGGSQKMSVVNESGMYALVMRSRKPQAKVFRKWVTSDVLPTIRKTGGVYMTDQKAEEILANPDLIIGLANQVKALRVQRDEAIRTKAFICEKREATAMGTAGSARRAENSAKLELRKSEFNVKSLESKIRLNSLKDDIRKSRNVFMTGFNQPCENCTKVIKAGTYVDGLKGTSGWKGIVHHSCNESYIEKVAKRAIKEVNK